VTYHDSKGGPHLTVDDYKKFQPAVVVTLLLVHRAEDLTPNG